jgi:hypothetical protein
MAEPWYTICFRFPDESSKVEFVSVVPEVGAEVLDGWVVQSEVCEREPIVGHRIDFDLYVERAEQSLR